MDGALEYLTAHFRNVKDLVASIPSTLATTLHTCPILLCLHPSPLRRSTVGGRSAGPRLRGCR